MSHLVCYFFFVASRSRGRWSSSAVIFFFSVLFVCLSCVDRSSAHGHRRDHSRHSPKNDIRFFFSLFFFFGIYFLFTRARAQALAIATIVVVFVIFTVDAVNSTTVKCNQRMNFDRFVLLLLRCSFDKQNFVLWYENDRWHVEFIYFSDFFVLYFWRVSLCSFRLSCRLNWKWLIHGWKEE